MLTCKLQYHTYRKTLIRKVTNSRHAVHKWNTINDFRTQRKQGIVWKAISRARQVVKEHHAAQ